MAQTLTRYFLRAVAAPALLACPAAATTAAQAPARPPALLVPTSWQDPASFRLVPENRSPPDTTHWTVTRALLPDSARRLAIQVMVATSHGATTVDSVLFDARTLLPVWEHTHGAASRLVRFAGHTITSESTAADGSVDRSTIATPGFAYSSTMDNFVVQSLPLAPGYRTVLPFWDGNRLELDTVTVHRDPRGSTRSAAAWWVADLAEPYAVETLWIDRATRRITRHVYTWRRNGTRSEVRASASRTR